MTLTTLTLTAHTSNLQHSGRSAWAHCSFPLSGECLTPDTQLSSPIGKGHPLGHRAAVLWVETTCLMNADLILSEERGEPHAYRYATDDRYQQDCQEQGGYGYTDR